MMAFPLVFISMFGLIFGVIAKVVGVMTGRSDDELIEDWNRRFELVFPEEQ